MKFLIDECLSPDLVEIARGRGFGSSTHVVWLGLRSKKDWTIVRRAVEEGYVLVTNNTTDFVSLVGREDIHAGLVCLNVARGLMEWRVQKDLFEAALNELKDEEPTNEVVEVGMTADRRITIDRYTRPDGDAVRRGRERGER